jgi:hypothetical protein
MAKLGGKTRQFSRIPHIDAAALYTAEHYAEYGDKAELYALQARFMTELRQAGFVEEFVSLDTRSLRIYLALACFGVHLSSILQGPPARKRGPKPKWSAPEGLLLVIWVDAELEETQSSVSVVIEALRKESPGLWGCYPSDVLRVRYHDAKRQMKGLHVVGRASAQNGAQLRDIRELLESCGIVQNFHK